MNTNRRAFLDMLGVSEGTSTCPISAYNGYDVIVMGIDLKHEVFTDFSDHPFANGRLTKTINHKGLTSTASGKYQIMLKDWAHYCKQLDLRNKSLYPDGAFSPAAQDAYALQLIRERSALPLIDHGSFDLAVARCRNLWASLPGAGYGQHENSLAKLQAAYVKAGGLFAVATTEAVVDAVQATPVKAAPAMLTIIMAILKAIFGAFKK